MDDEIYMLNFSQKHAKYFESINKEWINDMFVLEPIDKKVLEDPKTYIIDKGGDIFFAEHASMGVIGTCALLNKGEGNFELTKMGVSAEARSLKVGEKLLKFVIDQASKKKLNTLFLLTNKKCAAAIHLYEKNGFVHNKEIMETYGKSYERCNVAMKYVGNNSLLNE